MHFIMLIVVIAIVGAVVVYIQKYVPMPDSFKAGITLIAVVCLLLYVLQFFGLIGGHAPGLGR